MGAKVFKDKIETTYSFQNALVITTKIVCFETACQLWVYISMQVRETSNEYNIYSKLAAFHYLFRSRKTTMRVNTNKMEKNINLQQKNE